MEFTACCLREGGFLPHLFIDRRAATLSRACALVLDVKPVLAALLGDLALSRLRSTLTPTATIACRGTPEQAFSGSTRRADEPGWR
jgi:hypothetical protein